MKSFPIEIHNILQKTVQLLIHKLLFLEAGFGMLKSLIPCKSSKFFPILIIKHFIQFPSLPFPASQNHSIFFKDRVRDLENQLGCNRRQTLNSFLDFPSSVCLLKPCTHFPHKTYAFTVYSMTVLLFPHEFDPLLRSR